jgi:alpha-tubulin suppressor-like RCC1 family protein
LTSSFSPFGAVDPGGVTALYGQLAVGNRHGCAVTGAGQTWCWGDRSFGQLGNGIIAATPSTPVPVNGSPAYTAISSHGSHTCGLLSSGFAQCWGRNGGNLGNGTTAPSPTPVNVLGGPYLEISGGRLTTCALDIANVAWCWGINQSGEVGNPAFPNPGTTVPVQVQTSLRFRSIEASWQHTCSLLLDPHPVADTYCWGAAGTLGFPTGTPNFQTPVLVGGGVKFRRVFGGGTASCGISATLTAYCWGFNPTGALGDGTTTNSPTPVPVALNQPFVMLATGTRPNSQLTHSCGITLNGRAYCWGANDLGQLGDGTTTGKLVPTPVASNDRFVAIGAGDTFSCAMRADRKVFCWGDNALGELGSGVAGGFSTTPVEVPTPF